MRTSLLFVASCITVAANAAELPFRLATYDENVAIATATGTPLTQLNFDTAASVTVKGAQPNIAPSKTDRKNKALAQVYRGAISAGPIPSPQYAPPLPVDYATGLMNYEINPDSVQAWATMSELGTPVLYVYASGKSDGRAVASWSAQYTVPNGGSQDVYIRFTVPSANFYRRFENSGPSLYRARLRVDLLLNAFPAWSAEALMFNEKSGPTTEKAVYVDTFGSSLGLSADHINSPSAPQTVTLKLGTYAGGKMLDFTALFQIDTKVDTACVMQTVNNQPKLDEDGNIEYICSGLSAKFLWDPQAPPPTFYSIPAQ